MVYGRQEHPAMNLAELWDRPHTCMITLRQPYPPCNLRWFDRRAAASRRCPVCYTVALT